ncbi:MAG TPA: LEPR-XLL domain-containing protein [Candidatus Methylomirabilis sp.]|nr:LEPR-XLL domain-containing protein [Candidatus Methylomirabilis sp.]
MTIAELFYAKQANRARISGLPRRRGKLPTRRRKFALEALEPRLLLSADPLKYVMGGAVTDLTLRVEQDVDGAKVLQLLNNSSSPGAVVASRPLAQTSEVVITGSANDDTLIIGYGGSIPVSFTDAASGDRDSLKVLGGDTAWNITGPDAGTVRQVTFAGVETLVGAAGNQDTLVFGPGGSLDGGIDGGAGGFDTLVVEGDSYSTLVFPRSTP